MLLSSCCAINYTHAQFDRILAKHGIHKVEVLGDAFFVVGGCPVASVDHAERCANAALEMLAVIPTLRRFVGEDNLDMRVGLHTGPVVAGVVGHKDPRYHLFGATVPTANAMESSGIAGCVQVSDTTMALLRDRQRVRAEKFIARASDRFAAAATALTPAMTTAPSSDSRDVSAALPAVIAAAPTPTAPNVAASAAAAAAAAVAVPRGGSADDGDLTASNVNVDTAAASSPDLNTWCSVGQYTRLDMDALDDWWRTTVNYQPEVAPFPPAGSSDTSCGMVKLATLLTAATTMGAAGTDGTSSAGSAASSGEQQIEAFGAALLASVDVDDAAMRLRASLAAPASSSRDGGFGLFASHRRMDSHPPSSTEARGSGLRINAHTDGESTETRPSQGNSSAATMPEVDPVDVAMSAADTALAAAQALALAGTTSSVMQMHTSSPPSQPYTNDRKSDERAPTTSTTMLMNEADRPRFIPDLGEDAVRGLMEVWQNKTTFLGWQVVVNPRQGGLLYEAFPDEGLPDTTPPPLPPPPAHIITHESSSSACVGGAPSCNDDEVVLDGPTAAASAVRARHTHHGESHGEKSSRHTAAGSSGRGDAGGGNGALLPGSVPPSRSDEDNYNGASSSSSLYRAAPATHSRGCGDVMRAGDGGPDVLASSFVLSGDGGGAPCASSPSGARIMRESVGGGGGVLIATTAGVLGSSDTNGATSASAYHRPGSQQFQLAARNTGTASAEGTSSSASRSVFSIDSQAPVSRAATRGSRRQSSVSHSSLNHQCAAPAAGTASRQHSGGGSFPTFGGSFTNFGGGGAKTHNRTLTLRRLFLVSQHRQSSIEAELHVRPRRPPPPSDAVHALFHATDSDDFFGPAGGFFSFEPRTVALPGSPLPRTTYLLTRADPPFVPAVEAQLARLNARLLLSRQSAACGGAAVGRGAAVAAGGGAASEGVSAMMHDLLLVSP